MLGKRLPSQENIAALLREYGARAKDHKGHKYIVDVQPSLLLNTRLPAAAERPEDLCLRVRLKVDLPHDLILPWQVGDALIEYSFEYGTAPLLPIPIAEASEIKSSFSREWLQVRGTFGMLHGSGMRYVRASPEQAFEDGLKYLRVGLEKSPKQPFLLPREYHGLPIMYVKEPRAVFAGGS